MSGKKNTPNRQTKQALISSTELVEATTQLVEDNTSQTVDTQKASNTDNEPSSTLAPDFSLFTTACPEEPEDQTELLKNLQDSMTGAILEAIGDAVSVQDINFRIIYQNQAAKEKLGDHIGEQCYTAYQLREQICEGCQLEMCFADGKTHTIERSVAGNRNMTFAESTASPLRDASGKIVAGIEIVRDITERKRTEEALAERAKLATLAADIGVALTKGDTLQGSLSYCAEALLKHLGAASARIWTFDEKANLLDLQASAGLKTSMDHRYAHIPVGKYLVGQIARERQPHLTNEVIGDPWVHGQEWAKQEGIVSFAGHPLIVEERLVGVMGIFARKPLTEVILDTLTLVADGIALGIERKRAEEELKETSQTLHALVDASPLAIIAGKDNKVTLWNNAAERIFGWSKDEIVGGRNPIVTKEQREEFDTIQEQIRQDRKVTDLETRRRRKDGTLIDVSL